MKFTTPSAQPVGTAIDIKDEAGKTQPATVVQLNQLSGAMIGRLESGVEVWVHPDKAPAPVATDLALEITPARIAAYGAELARVQALLATRDREAVELHASAAESKAKLAALDLKVKELQTKLSAAQKLVVEHQTRLSATETEKADLKARLAQAGTTPAAVAENRSDDDAHAQRQKTPGSDPVLPSAVINGVPFVAPIVHPPGAPKPGSPKS